MTKVMIVDDEIYFATNIAKLLRANNGEMDVMAVYSAEEALKQLENSLYDIVVTDVRMAKMSGIEFIEAVKQKWPETAIILMTAYGTQDIMESAFNIGTLFYIEKHFRIEKLESLIATASKRHVKKPVKKDGKHL